VQSRKLNLSAELMVDPGCGARFAIRDTGAPGERRYHWTVTRSTRLTQWRRSGAGELGVIGAEASSRRRGFIDQAVKSDACLNTAPCHVHWCAAGNTRVRNKQARSREVRCIRIRG
jgi:hypothetical protein